MGRAMVTGASSGIGKEFAAQLAARGDDLVLVARSEDRLKALAEELRGKHRIQAEVLVADLTDRSDMGRVAGRLASAEQPIDLLVNNAGFGLKRRFLKNEIASEEEALELMVHAVLVLSHAAAGAMKERGHGAIVNVSSVAGFLATGTYSAAKAWVTVFSEGLAGELAGTGVTVTALCPGFTHTEFHERAGIDHGKRSKLMWLDAPDLVRIALADSAKGKVISVPGAQYKVISSVVRMLPRPLIRRGAITKSHRPQAVGTGD